MNKNQIFDLLECPRGIIKEKEAFSKMLNTQDNDFFLSLSNNPLIFHPFIHLDLYQPGPQPLFFETASVDIYINTRKTRTNLSPNSEMMESHDILNGAEQDTNSHTHTHD